MSQVSHLRERALSSKIPFHLLGASYDTIKLNYHLCNRGTSILMHLANTLPVSKNWFYLLACFSNRLPVFILEASSGQTWTCLSCSVWSSTVTLQCQTSTVLNHCKVPWKTMASETLLSKHRFVGASFSSASMRSFTLAVIVNQNACNYDSWMQGIPMYFIFNILLKIK